MIKKTLTYLDFNGESHTEDFYFHLQQNEIVELEFSHQGGLGEWLQAMVKSENKAEIMASFKNFIGKAYGHRYGEKNEKFRKEPEWTSEFLASNAYDVLFMELVTSEQAALEFIIGVVPAELSAGLDMQAIQDAAKTGVTVVNVDLPAENLYVPPLDQLKFPPGGVTAAEENKLAQEPVIEDSIPAAFRRAPAEQASSIRFPADMTREQVLAMYDKAMAEKREGGDPPPAA